MIGWLIFAGYLLMIMITWRIVFSFAVDLEDDPGDRVEVVTFSSIPAIFWPLTLVLAPMIWFVMRPTRGEKRTDRERKLREREREVERLARQYKLPLPD